MVLARVARWLLQRGPTLTAKLPRLPSKADAPSYRLSPARRDHRGRSRRARGRYLARRAPELAAFVATKHADRQQRRTPRRRGAQRHHARLLPAAEPQPTGQQRDRRNGGEPRRPVFALLRPEQLSRVPEPVEPARQRD